MLHQGYHESEIQLQRRRLHDLVTSAGGVLSCGYSDQRVPRQRGGLRWDCHPPHRMLLLYQTTQSLGAGFEFFEIACWWQHCTHTVFQPLKYRCRVMRQRFVISF